MTPPTDSVRDLLAHAGWVRGLARHLVRDPERADDLVQDTWVAALRHPPRASGSVAVTRAFLGRIMRNALLQKARGERHRRAREREHARSEVDARSANLVEEVDSHRLLIEEVLKLAEPARRTILLRYFRELSAAEIARAEGIPAATVRSRLRRALDELRERLDARHGGDRSAWSLGLLGWARPTPIAGPAAAALPAPAPLGLTPTLAGSLLMKTTKIAALIGLAAFAAYGVARLERAPAGAAPRGAPALVPPTAPPDAARIEPAHPPEPEVAVATPESERVPVADLREAAPTAERPGETTGPPPPSTITAAFVDREGVGVPGVELRFERLMGRADGPDALSTVSGAGGLASLELALERGECFAFFTWRAEGYRMGGLQAELDVGGSTDLGSITLLGGTPVSGRVVDGAGRPIAGARVWAGAAEIPAGDRGQIERKGPATVTGAFMHEGDTTPTVATREDGTFRIPGVGAGGARVWAHAEGMRYGASEPFDVVSGREVPGIEVVLDPLADDDRIEGVVLSRAGDPVPRARVQYSFHHEHLGMSSSLSADEEGRFRLVVWRKTAHTFTARDRDGTGTAHAAQVQPGTLDLVLRLGEQEAYELVVTDPEGRPVESYRVTTCLGDEDSWTGRVEQGEEHPGGRMRIGKPEARFWIEVRAVGHALGELGPFEPAEVPDLLELVLAPAPGVSGRVLVDGAPAAGARVELYRAVDAHLRLEVNGFPAFWQSTGEEGRTDEAGAFLLMAREAGEFLVRAELDGHAPGESRPVRLAANAGASDVDVAVGTGGTLVVQVIAPAGEDAAGVVVAVTRGDGHPCTRRSGADGLAVFEHLMPGRWSVLQTEKELEPFTTFSSSYDVPEDTPPPERPWSVEVHEGRTSRTTLVLPDARD